MRVDLNQTPPPAPMSLHLLRRAFATFGNILPGLMGKIAFRLFMTPKRKLIADKDRPLIDRALRGYVPFGKKKLATYAWGGRGDYTVVLVHGWESNAASMGALVKPLSDEGFRVIAFDMPAHGASDGQTTTLVEVSRAVKAVVEEYAPVHAIIAHSFGSPATILALPDLRVSKVVLLGSPSRLSDMVTMFCKTLHIPQAVRDNLEIRIAQITGRPVEYFSAEEHVRALKTPALIVHDRQDPIVPFFNGEAIARNWKNSTFVETDGLGHRGILRDEAVINEVVDFVATRQTVQRLAGD
jgi:pimeloyl-ACP methyl ester carboxylesterase